MSTATVPLKGQCHENYRPLMNGIGPHLEPLTGFAFFRPPKAKLQIFKVFFLEAKTEGEDVWL